jgi:hypothetical protein
MNKYYENVSKFRDETLQNGGQCYEYIHSRKFMRIKILPVQIKVIDIKETKGIINSGNFKCLNINYCHRTELLII